MSTKEELVIENTRLNTEKSITDKHVLSKKALN